MSQQKRMASASNKWESDPWDATTSLANTQLAGFKVRSERPVTWINTRGARTSVFGIATEELVSADVVCHAEHDGEDLLLMQLVWHGFPDPPEWQLATRPTAKPDASWTSWGYFTLLPPAWKMPDGFQDTNS